MSSVEESVSASELDALMREFPEWKEQFPDIYQQLHPPRYHKSRKSKDDAEADTVRVIHKKRNATAPALSDYQATYRKHHLQGVLRPRSTKKPPPEMRDPNPPPMTFDTNQRSEFVPKDLGCRPEPVKMQEQYQPQSSEPFMAKTNYQHDYDSHHPLPEITRPCVLEFQKSHLFKANTAKFDDRTTTKEHYKQWVHQPTFTFGDLPVFTGSILYPDQSRQLETTTQATFKGQVGRRSTPYKLVQGTLKPEGAMDMSTVNRLTYHSFNNAQPAQKVEHTPHLTVKKRSKFSGETQFQADFPGFQRGCQPKAPPSVRPPQATIDLRFDKSTNFQTEQRREFQGIDTKRHPVDRVNRKTEEYKPPTVQFETMTNQKIDYRPINIEEAYQPPIQGPQSARDKNLPKLDDYTINKHFFKRWQVEPRVRHGDFHENHSYVPPQSKFDSITTTGDTFRVPQGGEIPASFKPEHKRIVTDGSQDFNTMYRSYYTQPSKATQLTKKQQAQLHRELMKRKGNRQDVRVSGQNTKPIVAK